VKKKSHFSRIPPPSLHPLKGAAALGDHMKAQGRDQESKQPA